MDYVDVLKETRNKNNTRAGISALFLKLWCIAVSSFQWQTGSKELGVVCSSCIVCVHVILAEPLAWEK